ncbi:MAG TPA: methyltransferase domain-containing protein [Fimbriimonadaceae bacterium]|nr:methyltransferase domain-containing protein [Fimbriimonadaceae bacterium]
MNGWESSAQAWIDFVDHGDPNRVYVIDPAIRKALGPVRDLQVLDVGCGEGRFCRELAAQGADTVGIDPVLGLIEVARRRGGTYLRADAAQLPLKSDTFDLTLSILSLIDIYEFRTAILEMARVTRPGGRVIVANINSFATANTTGWIKDEVGKRLMFPIDNYMEERGDEVHWAGITVVNFHRPMSAYMQAFLKAGLRLMSYEELVPTENVAGMEDHWRMPYFHLMCWEKPVHL